MNFATGKAYLVGAGPGDPELMTLKARRILETADVVLYDYLVDKRILAWCRPDAELFYVGKSGLTGHHLTQDQIEALLVEQCRLGRTVCRLKGGDPYLFGRGGEEGERLFDLGIPFEVVPGITSAIAAPAYAGIPITHRDCASAVSIITGHEDPTKPESMLDWPTLAKMSGTLVFLMGVKQLPQIVAQLTAHGKSLETPVALVRWGTRPEQETLTGTLETISAQVEAHGFLPPCIIVIGEVVSKRPALNWFESLPLFGKTIAITRARTQASALRSQLEYLGGSVIEFPTIEIRPAENPEAIYSGLKALPTYDWVIFTSPNGVDYTIKYLLETGLDVRQFAGVKIATIGPATADALKRFGLVPDLMPREFVAEAIYAALKEQVGDLAGLKFMLPRADIARDALTVALTEAGAMVTDLPVYQTVMAQEGDDIDILCEALRDQRVDVITFSSSSTVTNFAARLSGQLAKSSDLLANVKLVSIGPITSKTLQDVFGRVDLEAPVHTIPGLVEAIVAHYSRPTVAV